MKFTPLSDRLVVDLDAEATRVGVIELPQNATPRSRSRRGVVVSVGPNVELCKPDDVVYVQVGLGVPIKDDERELVLVGEKEVLAKE